MSIKEEILISNYAPADIFRIFVTVKNVNPRNRIVDNGYGISLEN